MDLQDFDELIAQFLAAEKTAHIRPRWRVRQHPDYAEAKFVVGVPGSRILVGLVAMTAHRVKWPPNTAGRFFFAANGPWRWTLTQGELTEICFNLGA